MNISLGQKMLPCCRTFSRTGNSVLGAKVKDQILEKILPLSPYCSGMDRDFRSLLLETGEKGQYNI